jgi:hypothetical protein
LFDIEQGRLTSLDIGMRVVDIGKHEIVCEERVWNFSLLNVAAEIEEPRAE